MRLVRTILFTLAALSGAAPPAHAVPFQLLQSVTGFGGINDIETEANGNFLVLTTSGTVRRVNPAAPTTGTVIISGLGNTLGFDTNPVNGNISVVDTSGVAHTYASSGGTQLSQFSSVAGLRDVAVRPDGTELLINTSGSGIAGLAKILRFSTSGVALGNFATGLSGPTEIFIDAAGNVYVTESLPAANTFDLRKYDSAGVLQLTIGLGNQPQDLAVDAFGRIFVLEQLVSEVFAFTSSGASLGHSANLAGNPLGLDISAAGDRIYVGNGDKLQILEGFAVTPASVPEASSLALFGAGLGALLLLPLLRITPRRVM